MGVKSQETPTTAKQKKNKIENTQKNHITQNNQKNSKTENSQKEKKIKYRGRGKRKKINNIFSVLLTNLRGFRSKETSLRKFLNEKTPSMVCMNETLLIGNMKVSLPSYTSWSRNRTEKGGGGIATSIADQFKDCTVGVGQGEDEDEFLITRVECYRPALNVINCYGEQRSTRKEEVEKKWEKLRKEMERIRARKEFCLLAGDQNKHVGGGDLGVKFGCRGPPNGVKFGCWDPEME